MCSSGTVFHAIDTKYGDEHVALKKLNMHDSKEGFPRTALREIVLLQQLHHRNIIELKEIIYGQDLCQSKIFQKHKTNTETHVSKSIKHENYGGASTIYLVFEYCLYDLSRLLDTMSSPFHSSEIKCIVWQLLNAICHLHMNSIIHRDVKLSNLLVNSKGEIKLADFGLAREYGQPSAAMTENVVTLWYRSPELLFGSTTYSEKADMWAVGCIFGELLYHRPLLPGKNDQSQMTLICNLLGTPTVENWKELTSFPLYYQYKLPTNQHNNLKMKFPHESANCLDLLNRFLTFDPSQRIGARDALLHPYFTETPHVLPFLSISSWHFRSKYAFTDEETLDNAKHRRLKS